MHRVENRTNIRFAISLCSCGGAGTHNCPIEYTRSGPEVEFSPEVAKELRDQFEAFDRFMAYSYHTAKDYWIY
jgi:hypothetical protein